jgi:hypothetical protein
MLNIMIEFYYYGFYLIIYIKVRKYISILLLNILVT